MSVLELENIRKSYPAPDGKIEILSGVNLSVEAGDIVSIRGRSGSGKSTLLSVAALLLSPDEGRILYSGKNSLSLSRREREALRLDSMGFVFQSALLLADFSAEENIAMPMLIKGMKRKDALSRARHLLSVLGIEERRKHRPDKLSGGERQRVAIARAIALSPAIIFADEPTGSLDEKSAEAVERLLLEAVKDSGSALVYVTHDKEFALRAERPLVLTEGVLIE